MKGNSFKVLSILIVLYSCAKDNFETNSAPKTQSQVGIIASCTTKVMAQEVAKELGIKFRVIAQSQKLVEFIGASQEELEPLLPKSKFRKNKLYEKSLISSDFKAVSVNDQAYFGKHAPQYANSSTERYFPHLKQINALNTTYKGDDVVIAIVDTGVSYNHPHLSPNILTNPDETHDLIERNWKDDDSNGYRDDYVGWDFYNGDAFPMDDNGHGSHVAGLAASTLMGVAPKAKILPIKVLGALGHGDLGTIASGILYALDRGADVINLSLGGPESQQVSTELQQMINLVELAKSTNTIIVAAAGNGGNDGIGDCNDDSPVYPANIQAENLISVASVDANNELTNYSNFGGSTVHVAAPGGDSYTGQLGSTGVVYCSSKCEENNTPYFNSMGTSMATPIVSGLVALMKSKAIYLNYSEIKELIMNHSRKYEHLSGLIKSSGVINVQNTLNSI